LSHGLGDDDAAGMNLDFIRATQDRCDPIEAEMPPGLSLKMVALLPGLDQEYAQVRAEDCDRETGESGAASQIREVRGAIELG
jgi:hypothetical protein